MTIDKQILQKLLWAEAASFRADCADWKRNTEALQEFLGEKTVEEVALELLAENERLTAFEEAYATACNVRNRLIEENEALRKDAEIGRLVFQFFDRMDDPADCDPLEKSTGDFLRAVSAAMAKAVQP